MSFQEAKDALSSELRPVLKAVVSDNFISDLTGGYDSRLLLSFLYGHGGEEARGLHAFVFGPEGSREVSCVKQTCGNLGLVCHHDSLPDDWPRQFAGYLLKAHPLNDGEENSANYAQILWAQERKAREFNCSLNGLGGELYRDFWWLQEFGAIGRRQPANIGRLVRSRVLQYSHRLEIYANEWRGMAAGIQEMLEELYRKTNRLLDGQNTYNTTQIDHLYLREKVRRWAARTMTSSNQILRCVSPLLMKDVLSVSFVIPPRHKRFNRLVRGVVEMVSPPVSREKLLNETPYQLMRLGNLHRFSPLALEYGKKFLRKLAQVALRRTILLDRSLSYDRSGWYRAALRDERIRELVSYGQMKSAFLYERGALEQFLSEAREPGFNCHDQLGNMLSLELTLRVARLC